jgi:hypothetical protein
MIEGVIMKKIKTYLSLFIAVILVVLSIPSASVSAVELRYGKTVISQMGNKDSLLHLYNRLAEVCSKTQPEEINIDTSKYKITSAEFISLYHIFLADYPEYFWLNGNCKYSNDKSTGYVASVIPYFSIEGNSIKTANSAFEAKANSLIQGLGGKNDYEKSLILHDRLAENTEYVFTQNDQNAYGALVEGKAVCAGYSRAYQYLLHKVGIPAWCVVGESVNPANGHIEPHEWNLVCLDGKWYYTDVTWDDQDDYLFYAYLNITTKQMEENHTVTEFKEYLPNANSTDANYFYKNNLVYSNLDINKLANQLKTNDYKTRVYVNGNLQSFINSLRRNLPIILQKSGVPANYSYSYSTVAVGNEIDLDITLIEPNHKHNLTPVTAKAASCTAKGNTAYYTCTCGKWFSDVTAQTEIEDKQSVTIPAVSHTPSAWKNDNINHWKICSKCGVEIAKSSEHHTDADKNNKCDICTYNLPKDQIAASPTTSKPAQNNTAGNTSSKVTSTESVKENTSSQEETASEEETVLEPEDAPVAEAIPKKKLPIIPIAIGGASAAVIAAGVGIFFILKH